MKIYSVVTVDFSETILLFITLSDHVVVVYNALVNIHETWERGDEHIADDLDREDTILAESRPNNIKIH